MFPLWFHWNLWLESMAGFFFVSDFPGPEALLLAASGASLCLLGKFPVSVPNQPPNTGPVLLFPRLSSNVLLWVRVKAGHGVFGVEPQKDTLPPTHMEPDRVPFSLKEKIILPGPPER